MSKDSFTPKLEKPISKTHLFTVVYEAKGMKLCTQVPRICVHKCLVLDFHLFGRIGFKMLEFQTVHKIKPINIMYLFVILKENCSNIQGTQITVESIL